MFRLLIDQCAMIQVSHWLKMKSSDWLTDLKAKVPDTAADSCRELATELQTKISGDDTIFAPSDNGHVTSNLSSRFKKIVNLVSQAQAIKRDHPISEEFKQIQIKLRSVVKHLDAWTMKRPLTTSESGEEVKVSSVKLKLIDTTCYAISF